MGRVLAAQLAGASLSVTSRTKSVAETGHEMMAAALAAFATLRTGCVPPKPYLFFS